MKARNGLSSLRYFVFCAKRGLLSKGGGTAALAMITQEAKSRPARITGMHYNDHTRGHMRHTRPSASESRGVLQHQTLSNNRPLCCRNRVCAVHRTLCKNRPLCCRNRACAVYRTLCCMTLLLDEGTMTHIHAAETFA